jgi:hypothetical protein
VHRKARHTLISRALRISKGFYVKPAAGAWGTSCQFHHLSTRLTIKNDNFDSAITPSKIQEGDVEHQFKNIIS